MTFFNSNRFLILLAAMKHQVNLVYPQHLFPTICIHLARLASPIRMSEMAAVQEDALIPIKFVPIKVNYNAVKKLKPCINPYFPKHYTLLTWLLSVMANRMSGILISAYPVSYMSVICCWFQQQRKGGL